MRNLIRSLRRLGGFTLIELLTVMAVIAILAALILSISGLASKKAANNRAMVEIKALSAGCESYKADNGVYPHQGAVIAGGTTGNIPSDQLYPTTNGNSAASNTLYTYASLELYQALTGDLTGSGTGSGTKNYIVDLRSDVWGRPNMSAAVSSSNQVTYLADPFGNSYGYSTAYATAMSSGSGATIANTLGYNPTYDLWSTGGSLITPNYATSPATSGSAGDPMLQWIKNEGANW